MIQPSGGMSMELILPCRSAKLDQVSRSTTVLRMGTHRTYVRLTDTEVERAQRDKEWADTHLRMLDSRAGSWHAAPEGLRALDIDKSWFEIDIVMEHAGLPRTVLNGVRLLYPRDEAPDANVWEHLSDAEKRSMSPPTYRSPDEVQAISSAMNERPFAEMFDAVDPHVSADLAGGQVGDWTTSRDYVVSHGERLQRFFAAAAEQDDAIVVYFT
jgi:Domain of unknown function (DUF1877)